MAFLAVGLRNLRGPKRAGGTCLPMLEADSGSHAPLSGLPGASRVTRASPRWARCEGCHCTGGRRFLPSPSPFRLSTQLLRTLRFLSVKSSLPVFASPTAGAGVGEAAGGVGSVQPGGRVSWEMGRRLDQAESLQEVGGETSPRQKVDPVHFSWL